MVELEDEHGLVFWPEFEVAALTPEFRGRWRAVRQDGSIAHRPGPPKSGPWVALGDSLVLKQHLERLPEGWRDPAGFVHSGPDLPDAPTPPVASPIPNLGCLPDQVIGLRSQGLDSCIWSTDTGEITWAIPAVKAAPSHPHLVIVHDGLYLNPNRLRRIRWSQSTVGLELDGGSLFYTLHTSDCKALAEGLGLANLAHLEPVVSGLAEQRLRDYPVELATASAAQLKAWFDNPRQLIANLLFQAVRFRQMGIFKEYGTTHRGFWYLPVFATLYRAGFVDEGDTRAAGEELLLLYRRIVDELIGDYRLFTFRELGFEDPKNCHLGTTRPEVILLVEKESLQTYTDKLAAEFGVTYLVTGGTSKLVDTEYLVEALRRLVTGPVRVISYGDFDPEGWAVADGFVGQLDRYGMMVEGPVARLVLASCFTEEELSLYAIPCPTHGSAAATLAKRWLERSGGVHGLALGIHANHLQPVERVFQRMREVL